MVQVVAAIIIKDDKFLVARRAKHMTHAGMWEFPGGKIDLYETPEQAVERELYEEFNVKSEVQKRLCTVVHDYDSFTIELMAFETRLLEGDLELHDHDQIAWLRADELATVGLTEADQKLVGQLQTDYFPVYLTSPDKQSSVSISQGELISYQIKGEELIHQKGDPGWRNSDTEMFPVIGPTAANHFLVQTERGDAVQDQHGLLRELPYKVLELSENTVTFAKAYEKQTPVKNSKFPEKSPREEVYWPYSFEFSKKYSLQNGSLLIRFEVRGESGMPYMLGYHPAFKLSGENNELISFKERRLELQKILDVGAIAYPVLNANSIELHKLSGKNISIKTKGFDNFMLWTEVPNMLCIEPITAYPYTGKKALAEDLFRHCEGVDIFEVLIEAF